MLDKKGKELELGDTVKVFTYKKGVIVGFRVHPQLRFVDIETAVVRHKDGTCEVYPEEIKKVTNGNS